MLFSTSLGVRAVEHHELRWVEGQADIKALCFYPERPQFGCAFPHHVVKLGHVRMGGVGRQVGGHPVHSDAVPVQVVEDPI